MKRQRLFSIFIPLSFFTIVTGWAQVTHWKLANGMEMAHIQKPSSKVIASIVTVNVGSKDETPETNGLSHLLEHMVFDGTQRRTRAEINEGSKRYGGYVNATTRTGYTSYISVFPVEYAELSLDLQADMLFHSTLPEEELAKERNVVIEEIKRDRDRSSTRWEETHNAHLFGNTPYALPVLGYEDRILAVPRSTVQEYYRKYYVPSRMKTLVISPFPVEEVQVWVEKTFAAATAHHSSDTAEPAWSFPEQAAPVYKEGEVKTANVRISVPAPPPSDADFIAYDLITRYLSDDSLSPVVKVLRDRQSPLADHVGFSLESQSSFSLWHTSAVTSPDNVPQLLTALRTALVRFSRRGIPVEDLARLRRRVLSEDAILAEQPHYFGLFKAHLINAMGLGPTLAIPETLQSISAEEIRTVAEKYFASPRFFSSAVVPPGRIPTGDMLREKHTWEKTELSNGLTLVAQGNDESEIFALCVLTRHRSQLEEAAVSGISDFVHRMLFRGTASKSKEEIEQSLDRISAQIQYVDNPYIPYDDHYTSNRFTFLRLEVLDVYRDEALALVTELLTQTDFPEAEISRVRHELLQIQAGQADNSSKVATQRLQEILLGGTAYERNVLGSRDSISGITRDQLRDHFRHLYSPSNLVIVAAGKGSTDGLMRDLKSRFGSFEGDRLDISTLMPADKTPKRVDEIIRENKQQTQIALGKLTAGWNSTDATALRVLNAILSERLAVELRETQGLAYSVGSRLTMERDFGWIEIYMGTRAESAERAQAGLKSVIAKLAADGISTEELERAVNGLWGSTLRSRLSRIGQAFYRGIDEVMASGHDEEERLFPALRAVTPQTLRRLAADIMADTGWITVLVGPKSR